MLLSYWIKYKSFKLFYARNFSGFGIHILSFTDFTHLKNIHHLSMGFSRTDFISGVVAFACFIIHGLLVATAKQSSLLFTASIERFNTDRESTSFAFVLFYATRNAFGPIVGYLGTKFGIKSIILCGCFLSSISVFLCFFAENIIAITVFWGLGFGISFGLGGILVPQIAENHFSNHLDKAIGLILGGECAIFLPLTLVTEFSLKTYGYSGTFLMLSGALLHTIPACLLLRILDQSRNTSLQTIKSEESLQGHETKLNENDYEDHSEDSAKSGASAASGFKVFLDPIFFVLMFTQSSLFYVYVALQTIFVDVSRDHGVSPDDVVYPLMGFAVATAVGGLFLGFITDGEYMTKMNFSALCFAIAGFLLIVFLWLNGFTMVMFFSLSYGLLNGGLFMMGPSMCMHYVDEKYYSFAIASRYLLYAPLSFTQAPLIGYFRDTLQSYDGLFFILIGVSFLSAILSLLASVFIKYREKRRQLMKSLEYD